MSTCTKQCSFVQVDSAAAHLALPAQLLLLCSQSSNTIALQAVLTEMLFEAHELLEEVQDSMPDDPEEEP